MFDPRRRRGARHARPGMPEPIKVLLVADHTLFRAALAALLDREADIHVVGQLAGPDQLIRTARRCRPDVVVLDPANSADPADPAGQAEQAPAALAALGRALTHCRLLVLTDHHHPPPAERAPAALAAVSFLPDDAPPDWLAQAVRLLAGHALSAAPA